MIMLRSTTCSSRFLWTNDRMTIEFQCPHCSAQIRVADSAAGRKGSCPQCKAKLLVPNLPRPAALDPTDSSRGSTPMPANAEPLPAEAAPVPLFDVAIGEPAGRPVSIARQVRQKRRASRSKGKYVMPTICGLLLAAVAVWYTWQGEPSLSGKLAAAPIQEPELAPGMIPKSLFDLSPELVADALADLEKHPARLNSDIMEVTLRGAKQGLQVQLREGVSTRFFRVNPLQNPALRAWLQKNVTRLDEAREAELAAGGKKFLNAVERQVRHKEPVKEISAYRNSVGLAALVRGTGYAVEAVCGNVMYWCVYEDSEGGLYFLLPKSTQTFEIQGRPIRGQTLFPGRFEVAVSEPDAAALEAVRKIKPKAQAKPTFEEEPLGLNPELHKNDPPPAKPKSKSKSKSKTKPADGMEMMMDEPKTD